MKDLHKTIKRSESRKMGVLASLLFLVAPPAVSAQPGQAQEQSGFVTSGGYVPINMDGYNELLKIYLTAGRAAFKDGQYAVAERVARNGLDALPGDETLLRLRGESLIRLGHHEEALVLYSKLYEQRKNPGYFARAGLLLSLLGRHAESKSLAGQGLLESTMPKFALDYIPKLTTARDVQLYWLLAIGIDADSYHDLENMVYYYSQAQKLRPHCAWINLRLGHAFYASDRLDDAIEAYSKATVGNEYEIKQAMTFLMTTKSKKKRMATAGSGG